MRLVLATLMFATLASAAVGQGVDVAASPPTELSVTVYRAPYRGSGGIDLGSLDGFALVTETRVVRLPAGESRLRFEGVADGIDPASAIVAGLPNGVVEKNRDAYLLSPSALVTMAVGRPVELVRTYPKGGGTKRTAGRIRSDADGVVFESAEGVEALRCSGLSETFSFEDRTTGLSAKPTLSVLTRSDQPVTATVTLSYLAYGFDWSADYVATLTPAGDRLDLGAWVTLANSNTVGFPDARTQVVAGRLNKESDEVEPIDTGEQILANCWPRGSTSDAPERPRDEDAVSYRLSAGVPMPPPPPPPPMALGEVVVTAEKVVQERLGDLKLYRVPMRTTVAANQAKQVRLLDRSEVPVERIYEADLGANDDVDIQPADVILRTRNDSEHHLGLPLPSGQIEVFQQTDHGPLLVGETHVRDLAEKEEVEWRLGPAPDVAVTQIHDALKIDRSAPPIPFIPGLLSVSFAELNNESHVVITNAEDRPRAFELRLQLDEGERLARIDHPAGEKNGRPIVRLTLAPNSTTVVRYVTGVQAAH